MIVAGQDTITDERLGGGEAGEAAANDDHVQPPAAQPERDARRSLSNRW